jgi:hypothetical protein
MADPKTPAMTRAEMLLYLKKERSSHGKRVVDAFHNARTKFYKACPFSDSAGFIFCATVDRHGLLIERVFNEYLNLKLIGE